MKIYVTGCSCSLPLLDAATIEAAADALCTQLEGDAVRLTAGADLQQPPEILHKTFLARCKSCPNANAEAVQHLAPAQPPPNLPTREEIAVAASVSQQWEAQTVPEPIPTLADIPKLDAPVPVPAAAAPQGDTAWFARLQAMAEASAAPAPPAPPAPTPDAAWVDDLGDVGGGMPPAPTASPDAIFDGAMTHPAAVPSFRDLLPKHAPRGPSVAGTSTLSAFRQCMRKGFYSKVCGLYKPRATESVYVSPARGYETWKFNPLDYGALFHELLAELYRSFEPREALAVLDPIQPHYPHLCDDVRRIFNHYCDWHLDSDKRYWDVRAIEAETRLYFPKKRVKSAKKNLAVCVSCRVDLLVHEMQGDEPRLPPGEPADHVMIVEHKTAGTVTQDLKSAFAHDPQLLQQIATYKHGMCVNKDGIPLAPTEERYGKLMYVMPNIVGKAQDHDPRQHLPRVKMAVPEPLIDGFVDDLRQWVYTEWADRLFHPQWQEEETWPKSYQCRDPMSGRPCAFIDLCAKGGMKSINVNAFYSRRDPYNREAILKPETKVAKPRKGKTKPAAEVERK